MMRLLKAIRVSAIKTLETIKGFVVKTNEEYDKLREPNRFFIMVSVLCVPMILLSLTLRGQCDLVWVLIAIIWRASYGWCKTSIKRER